MLKLIRPTTQKLNAKEKNEKNCIWIFLITLFDRGRFKHVNVSIVGNQLNDLICKQSDAHKLIRTYEYRQRLYQVIAT